MHNAIEKVLKLAKTQAEIAKILNITPQAVSKQLKKGKLLPEHCIALEKHYNGLITRYELDPDHFGEAAPTSDCIVVVIQNLQTKRTSI